MDGRKGHSSRVSKWMDKVCFPGTGLLDSVSLSGGAMPWSVCCDSNPIAATALGAFFRWVQVRLTIQPGVMFNSIKEILFNSIKGCLVLISFKMSYYLIYVIYILYHLSLKLFFLSYITRTWHIKILKSREALLIPILLKFPEIN